MSDPPFAIPDPETPLAQDLGKLKASAKEKRTRILSQSGSSNSGRSRVAPFVEGDAISSINSPPPIPKPPRLWRRAKSHQPASSAKTLDPHHHSSNRNQNKKNNKNFNRQGSWGGWGGNRNKDKHHKNNKHKAGAASQEFTTSPPASAPLTTTTSIPSHDSTEEEPAAKSLTTQLVQQSWQVLYTRDGIEEELGQLALDHMQQQKDATVSKLRLSLVKNNNIEHSIQEPPQDTTTTTSPETSPPSLDLLDDDRFSEVCTILVELVDMIVTVFLDTPNLSDFDEELLELGVRCSQEGLDVTLLAAALLYAFEKILGRSTWTTEVEAAWKESLEEVIPKMIVPKHHWIMLSY